FRVNSVYSANAIVFERESFGWELTSASDLNIAMSRDTSIPHYMKLLQYENDYNEHLNRFYKYHRRARFNLKIYLILLLILVVPGFLYIIYKVYNSMKAK